MEASKGSARAENVANAPHSHFNGRNDAAWSAVTAGAELRPSLYSGRSSGDQARTLLRSQLDETQLRSFTRWWNSWLSEISLETKDLCEDIKQGVMSIRLLEVLSDSSCGKVRRATHHECNIAKACRVAAAHANAPGGAPCSHQHPRRISRTPDHSVLRGDDRSLQSPGSSPTILWRRLARACSSTRSHAPSSRSSRTRTSSSLSSKPRASSSSTSVLRTYGQVGVRPGGEGSCTGRLARLTLGVRPGGGRDMHWASRTAHAPLMAPARPRWRLAGHTVRGRRAARCHLLSLNLSPTRPSPLLWRVLVAAIRRSQAGAGPDMDAHLTVRDPPIWGQ